MTRATLIVVLLFARVLIAADPKPAPEKSEKSEKPKKPAPRWLQMDYGPFLSLSITDKPNPKFDNTTGLVEGDVVPRGIAIKLTDDWTTGVVFDADLCRLAYAWSGARPNWTGIIFDGGHGPSTQLGAPPIFKTPPAPGFANSQGSFKDPRPDIIKPQAPPGPLPRDWAKY